MAIALHSSTPIRWTGIPSGTTVITSAAFTAPTDAWLALCVEADGGAGDTYTLNAADTGGLAWTKRVERAVTEAVANSGSCAIFTARTTSSVSRTVDASRSGTSSASNRISATCYVFTGVDVNGTPVDSVTASNEGTSAANPTTTTSVTPGATGVLVATSVDWAALGAMTSSDLLGIDSIAGSNHGEYAGAIDVISGWKVCTSGVGVTANIDPPAGTPDLKWCQIVLREPTTAPVLVPSYQKFPKFRLGRA